MSHRHVGSKPKRTIDPHVLQGLVKIVRDLAIFILGGIGFVHELTRTGTERPQILILSAAMMGLPVIIRGDERRQEVKTSDKPKTSANEEND